GGTQRALCVTSVLSVPLCLFSSVRPVIVVLDGPAGAGKSSVSKRLAKRLGVAFMDTGAMYRAFTWRAMQKGLDLLDVPALVRSTDEGRLFMTPDRITMDGIDVTKAIRTPEVTAN